MTKAERIEKEKRMLQEMQVYERELRDRGVRYIAGIDEVGRGPLAGPVVAAAVILPEDFDVLGVNDSKKLSEKRREELFIKIKEKAIAWAIGMADNRIIDEINILQATKQAMREAVGNLEVEPEHLLIDAVKLEDVEVPQTSIIKGDEKSLSVAAASILAKVTRDHMMVDYANEFPGYAFEKNKGYGTKAHYEGLRAQGLCPIHRKTFLKSL